jgi:hypothetical protein
VVIWVLLLCALGVAIAWKFGFLGDRGVSAEEITRVLFVAAAPDEEGAVLAQVICVVDITATPVTIMPVSPETSATIPGTSYNRLADAYAFGGGAGTARALAAAAGGEPLPYVALAPGALAAAIEAAGPVTMALPADMSVFDGETLYTFAEGEQSLSADEVLAVFKGAPYLESADRDRLDAELASALMPLVAAADITSIDTDLSDEALSGVRQTLASLP